MIQAPSLRPTTGPTAFPTRPPTLVPTELPTRVPTALPTTTPTRTPTELPTRLPTDVPTTLPTRVPSAVPTQRPTQVPTLTSFGLKRLAPSPLIPRDSRISTLCVSVGAVGAPHYAAYSGAVRTAYNCADRRPFAAADH